MLKPSVKGCKDPLVRLLQATLKVHPLRDLPEMNALRTPAASDVRLAAVDIVRTIIRHILQAIRRVLQCLHHVLHHTGIRIRGAGRDGLAHPVGLAGPDLPACLACLQLLGFLASLVYLRSQGFPGSLDNREFRVSMGYRVVVAGSVKARTVPMVCLSQMETKQALLVLPAGCIATSTRIQETNVKRLRHLVRPDIATTTSGAAATAFQSAPAGGHGRDGGRHLALQEALAGLVCQAGPGQSVRQDIPAGLATLGRLRFQESPDSLQSPDFLESLDNPLATASTASSDASSTFTSDAAQSSTTSPSSINVHLCQCMRFQLVLLRGDKKVHLLENNALSGWDAFDQACAQDADRGGAINSGSLVSIHTSGEQSFAHSLASRLNSPLDHTGGFSVWIGGKKADRFRWSSKIDSQDFGYTRWEPPNPAIGFYPGMPDNNIYRNSTQNCVRMQVRRPAHSGLLALNGEWDDIECYNALFKAGVCQARPFCVPNGRR